MSSRVAVIVGSLRKASWNRKVAQALIAHAPSSLALEIVEIGQLPLYDQDLDDEGRPPAAWADFRARIASFDALLFVTPEYNRSVPAPLKNAIDVGSRPYGRSVWNGKPGAVVSVSPGAMGGFGANHHLRQSLVFLNVPCLQMPEAYVGGIADRLGEDGRPKDESTRSFFEQLMTAYAAWVDRIRGNAPA